MEGTESRTDAREEVLLQENTTEIVTSVQPSCSTPKGKKNAKRTMVSSKSKNPKRRKEQQPDDEVEALLQGISQDINDVLEETAERNRLTAVNVKNILRHVITNKDVLAMVWNTMKSEEGLNSLMGPEMTTVYEQKLTRSKVRKLCGGEATTSVRKADGADNDAKKLLEEEFPENESSDEEYCPASANVDDDTDEEVNIPKLTDTLMSPARPSSPVPFEELSGDSSLHIAEEESFTLEDEDKIALRTRSKLPLDDTPLESIEAAFVAPDITTDMYDSECDDEDWRAFLGDFLKPVSTSSVDVEEDDEQEDPEYNFLEEEDVTDTWDLRNDRAVKVSKKELNDLVAELIEATDQDCVSPEEEENVDCVSPGSAVESEAEDQASAPEQLLTSESRAILDQQMRMHVQLLLQMNVVCLMDPALQLYRRSSQYLLLELKQFADSTLACGKKSAFAAANLLEAIDVLMVNSHILPYENSCKKHVCTVRKSRLKCNLKDVPKYAQNIIAVSKAFVYPELLPLHAFLVHPAKQKITFTIHEDQLLAMGLEQFEKTKDMKHFRDLRTYLLPSKTEQQIRVHVKNIKRSKLSEDNPLKYYFKHNKAPPVTHKLLPFDPKNIVPPRNRPIGEAPPWLRKFVKFKTSAVINISPACSKPSVVKSPVVTSAVPTGTVVSLQKARFNPILPRLNVVSARVSPKSISPLKQISPILKKYGYHSSRVPPRVPLRLSFSPTKKERTPSRPLAPKSTTDIVAKAINISALPLIEEGEDGMRDSSGLTSDSSICPTGLEKDSSVIASVEASFSESTVAAEQSAQKEVEKVIATSNGEIADEGEDVDNEGDLEALMLSSSTICKKQHSIIKKKNKQQRDLEVSLSLLAPDILGADPLRDSRLTHFARSYVEKVREMLRDDVERFGLFLQTLCEFESSSKSVVQLFGDISGILSDHPHLVNDFVSFLTPEQAHQCGKLEENVEFTKFQTFLRKMEIYQPHQLSKFLKVLVQLQKETTLSKESVFSTVQPFLRNQIHLIEEFSRLFPDEAPPTSAMTEFEEITVPDSDEEMNTDEDVVEEFVIPETEDLCGTKQCPCTCHTESRDPRMQSRNRHCVKCGIKFIDGRIFLQCGKGLKPAQVVYRSESEYSDSKSAKRSSSPSTSLSSQVADSKVVDGEKVSKNKTTDSHCMAGQHGGQTLATCNNICGMQTLKVALPSTSSDIYLQSINEEEGAVEIYDPFALAVQQVMTEEGSAKEAIAEQYGLSFSNPCREPWTKAEDKCLLETCQQYGATDRAFAEVTETLEGRMLEDVKHRFLELMSLFTVHSGSEDLADSD